MEDKRQFDNTLWNLLLAHRGHELAVVCYGDEENPQNVSLECEDCGEVVLDAGLYTVCAREDNSEVPTLAGMAKMLRNIITAHNRMIETIENAGITCNLFRGMEVWHKIACEGAEITGAARSIGIDAKVDMQSGVISVLGVCTVALPNGDWLLDDIISNLEDQARDRDSSADKDDPDCIFRRDAEVLRAAAMTLRKVEDLIRKVMVPK